MLIGLTGGIGSGKSLAASLFRDLGARVIDADILCRELVLPNRPAWKEIVEKFGSDILQDDERLDRKKISSLIFSDPAKKLTLESILHPKVFEEERRRYQRVLEGDPDAVVIVDAAMLIESGNHKNMDKVIVVRSRMEDQVERVVKRNGWSREQVIERLNSQMSVEEKLLHVDFIIENDGDLANLRDNVSKVFKDLTGKAKA
ncbi:MAG: dephospho-CoA kinase [Nitrospinae bacterium CG11_big_fil_rev_8_21_14_0_20_45_15]|nr:MAG: dephospho-CoA kinase [Nitrospinae bacterium CG11_big_fil_rev_8_21_14_0_20_45_15]